MKLGEAINAAVILLRQLQEDDDVMKCAAAEAGMVYIISKIYSINADMIQTMIHEELDK